MDVQQKINLIKKVGEEILTEEDLRNLLETKKHPIAYDGFEPSGRLHIAQGILRAININHMTNAGCHFKMLLADWHAWANNKLGGNLDHIQTVGSYFIEVWKSAGLNTDRVEFVWCSDFCSDETYWKKVLEIGRNTTLHRVIRTTQIMGRTEQDTLSAAQIFYPCMQCADIFHLNVDITQLGMDQRKVNILARELGPKLNLWKPVAVHHHMLMGLSQPPQTQQTETTETKLDRTVALKMSKSNPDSAIFMDDTEEEVTRKIMKAYCPQKIIAENPLLDYTKYLLFERFPTITVTREEKYGGDTTYHTFDELSAAYQQGNLHPTDLKTTVATYLNRLLDPMRAHFKKGKPKKLLEEIKTFTITR